MEHTVVLNNGTFVTLKGDLDMDGYFIVLCNGHTTYRFHWLNVAYCRTRNKD